MISGISARAALEMEEPKEWPISISDSGRPMRAEV
jgi:hypothetical protein